MGVNAEYAAMLGLQACNDLRETFQEKDTIRGLKSAEGFIRTQLAKKSKSSEHSADLLCAGPVYRVRRPHVQAHR